MHAHTQISFFKNMSNQYILYTIIKQHLMLQRMCTYIYIYHIMNKKLQEEYDQCIYMS